MNNRNVGAVEPPRLPRMAELVAAQLRRRIITGDLQDGDELPREAEMVQEFGVSRPSLREGIRILETEGLIRIRRGKIGGAVVKRPTAESTAYHVGLTLQSRGTTLEDLAAARAVLEPACASIAASQPKQRRNKIVRQLNALIEENEQHLGETFPFTESALRFHAALVEHCGNTTITLLAGALGAVWSSQERLWAHKVADEGSYPDVRYQRDVIAAHRRVVKQIDEGNQDGAMRSMRTHLAKSQPYVNYDNLPIEVLDRR